MCRTCRDGAEKRIAFESAWAGEELQVTLCKNKGYSRTCIAYFIDTEKDVIEGISFSVSGGPGQIEGALVFSYLDDISRVVDEFTEPAPAESELPIDGYPGIEWLFQLAEDLNVN